MTDLTLHSTLMLPTILPIRFFEAWIDWIVGFDEGDTRDTSSYYRAKYRDDYAVDGLKITKFEKKFKSAATSLILLQALTWDNQTERSGPYIWICKSISN